jgi:tRNA(Ile)-lysidine synthase
MTGASEAAWRAMRQEFLIDVARRAYADVATAHTRDDQVETVVMRVLRDSGARGLAGLYAESPAVRPLLEFSREEVAAYGDAIGVRWVEDPTNSSMRFLRNRVRRDLLPALTNASPGLDDTLLGLARGAAQWRHRLDAFVASVSHMTGDRAVSVAVADLSPYSPAELAVIWPAIAARVGLAMDWRGTERAAAFTNASRTGARIQLSGGWEIARTRDRFELRPWR